MTQSNGKNSTFIITTPTKGNEAFMDEYGNQAVERAVKQSEATKLIDKLTGYAEQDKKPVEVKTSIPCGYKEPISEGKTLTCGNTYRGETFYCRDCMKAMMANAHEVSNTMAEVMLVAFNDHAINGSVSQSTIDAMGNILAAIGCVNVEDNEPVIQQ